MELLGLKPLPIRMFSGQFSLDLLIGDDAAAGGVHQEHSARLQAQALNHGGRVEVEHAGLRGHHHQAVLRHPDARGTQSIAVEHRAHDGTVGETH